MAGTGVDILEKDQKTFRSTYDILLDISKVWNQIDDEVTKSSILEALAGKMQSNIMASILNNGDMLANVYKEANDSVGSAMQEQERWSESLEAKSQHITAVFESISAKVFDSESLKTIYDGLGKILELIDSMLEKGQGLQLLAGTLGGILGASGNGFINVSTIGIYWKEVNAYIEEYNNIVDTTGQKQLKFANDIQGTNAELANYIRGLNGAKAGLAGYTANIIAAGVQTVITKTFVIALNAVINAGIMVGISALISLITSWINHNKELTETLKEASGSLESTLTSLDDYKKKIEEIVESEKDEVEQLRDLKTIKDELEDKYGIEVGKINDVTEARKLLNDEIDKQIKNERKLYLEQNEEAYNTAKKKVTDNYAGNWLGMVANAFNHQGSYITDNSGKFHLQDSAFGNKSIDNISEEIRKLFDSYSSESIMGLNGTSFNLGINAKDEIEYMNILKTKIDEFYDIRDMRAKKKNPLTEEEENLYQMMLDQYNSLESKNANYIENIQNYSEQRAQWIIDTTKRQLDQTDEEYLHALMLWANGDIYVEEAIKNIIRATKEAEDSTESLANNANSELAVILSNLNKIGSSCSELSTKIDEADEKFEKLTKTIEDNKDTSKFFSASDIIEILDLYPSLSDSVLECAYGYKIEEEALESLRQAKLEEQKTAIQAQLDETNQLLTSTKEKLKIYEQELKGIKSVAEAKAKIAEIDAKISGLSTNGVYNIRKTQRQRDSLNAEKGKYQDYINAANAVEEYENQLGALNTQLEVLGTVHDDLSDATSDATKNLNAEKDAINELKDAYSDAKDAIEDLIKLTMDMIKKNKNLEKDALSEQLSNYKELISKKKELIDLEKENYEFSKKLKDQNKSLLQTQLELEALSVEGVNYSLEDQKRKLELEQELVEKQEDRTDLLYDHEVDVRKDALDKEQELFEKQINAQIKSIEDYLDKEGQIRADAIDLINGKSEQFYNDLMNYTMTYTDKSKTEFTNLWNKAYEAILTYANGTYDADLALSFLINSMELAEAQLKSIENAINNIQNATTAAKDAQIAYNQVLSQTQDKLSQLDSLKQSIVTGGNGTNASDIVRYIKGSYAGAFHSGGIVGGLSNEHGEVLAKLLSGEVVVTENQARNFMENTLPKLTGNVTTNNSSIAPVINMGDINISGNADQTTVNQIKSIQKSIVEDVFKAINNQNNTFNGSRLRFI